MALSLAGRYHSAFIRRPLHRIERALFTGYRQYRSGSGASRTSGKPESQRTGPFAGAPRSSRSCTSRTSIRSACASISGWRLAISCSRDSASSTRARCSRLAPALQETLLPGFGRTVDTGTRNLAASYTHVFSRSVVHETRFGWMRTKGGQVSQNQGVDFAGESGLQGVTRDPRDVGSRRSRREGCTAPLAIQPPSSTGTMNILSCSTT